MYQEISIIGRLGSNPTVRTGPDGVMISSFSVAVNRGTEAKPIWFRVSAWGKQAELCNNHLKKGDMCFAAGYLTAADDGYPRMWKRQDGTLSASFELTATRVIFCGQQDREPGEGTSEERGKK